MSVALQVELDAGERIVVAASRDASRIGRDLAELATGAGVAVGDLAVTVLRDDPDALFVFRHAAGEATRAAAARTIEHPGTIVASDGIYRPGLMHPRGYGTFPRILRLAVREWGVIDLATAINAMTARAAARYRVPGRGRIGVGRIADLVVFQPDIVADQATWDVPRLAPVGIEHVLVNGVPVVRDGHLTGARPGRVLAAA